MVEIKILGKTPRLYDSCANQAVVEININGVSVILCKSCLQSLYNKIKETKICERVCSNCNSFSYNNRKSGFGICFSLHSKYCLKNVSCNGYCPEWKNIQ